MGLARITVIEIVPNKSLSLSLSLSLPDLREQAARAWPLV